MNPKILKQDSNYDEWSEQEIINAYKEAAELDECLLFEERERLTKEQALQKWASTLAKTPILNLKTQLALPNLLENKN